MAIKRPGAYTPLAAHYADDERIMEVGEDAELMYIRILAYCGRTPKTEGWISDKQIRTRIGLETRPEIGPDTAPETRAERLLDSGLLLREGDGYRVASWLKWNRSVEEMDRTHAQDANRSRRLTSTNTGTGTGKRTGNDTGVRSELRSAETETETETEVISRKRSLPKNFAPNDNNRKVAAEEGVNLERELVQFKEWHVAKGSKFTNWNLALNTWLRKTQSLGRTPAPTSNGTRRLPNGEVDYEYYRALPRAKPQIP